MKRRFVSILCAATMVASLMTGATVVSAADKDVKDISTGVSFGQNVHPFFVAMQKGIEQACTDLGVENVIFWQRIALWKRRYHRLKILLLKEVMFFF